MDNKQAPPPGYVPVSTDPSATVVTYPVNAATVHIPQVPQNFGPHSQTVTCSSCHHQISTKVKAETYMMTHLVAALLCLVSCCCLPYLMDTCKRKNHYCPNCGAFLGFCKEERSTVSSRKLPTPNAATIHKDRIELQKNQSSG